jgi:flagellar biosynthesis/type III secretory pathway ATPase
MELTRFGETCTIKQANSNKTVEAAVHEFKEQRNLTVVLNKSVKLPMTWNGKMYEGRMAGIDFVSEGPSIIKTKIGR